MSWHDFTQLTKSWRVFSNNWVHPGVFLRGGVPGFILIKRVFVGRQSPASPTCEAEVRRTAKAFHGKAAKPFWAKSDVSLRQIFSAHAVPHPRGLLSEVDSLKRCFGKNPRKTPQTACRDSLSGVKNYQLLYWQMNSLPLSHAQDVSVKCMN